MATMLLRTPKQSCGSFVLLRLLGVKLFKPT
jgi:hypothetical protein